MMSKVEWINKANKVIYCNESECDGQCETCEYDTEESSIDLLKEAKNIFEKSLFYYDGEIDDGK